MRILIIGAGVLGSLYGSRCRAAGHAVVMLARGQRLSDLRLRGLMLEDAVTGQRTFAPVDVVETLAADDPYDWVIVPVRLTELQAVLPLLAANKATPNILFMVCNPSGPDEMVAALGRDRVLAGYAGAGGVHMGPVIRYTQVSPLLQRTVVGELDGRITPRLKAIRRAFREAGFPTALSSNIDAWLKTHVAWVSPFAQALYREDGDILQLAASAETVRLMVRAVREGFRSIRALGIPPTGPLWVRSQARLPEAVLVRIWRAALRTQMARISMAGHANAAREEMIQVADRFQALVAKAGLPSPALDRLRGPEGPASPGPQRSR